MTSHFEDDIRLVFCFSQATDFEGKTVRDFIALLCETELFVCRAGNLANFFAPIDTAGVSNVSFIQCARQTCPY